MVVHIDYDVAIWWQKSIHFYLGSLVRLTNVTIVIFPFEEAFFLIFKFVASIFISSKFAVSAIFQLTSDRLSHFVPQGNKWEDRQIFNI